MQMNLLGRTVSVPQVSIGTLPPRPQQKAATPAPSINDQVHGAPVRVPDTVSRMADSRKGMSTMSAKWQAVGAAIFGLGLVAFLATRNNK